MTAGRGIARGVAAGVAVWCAVAVVAGWTEVMRDLPRPALQGTLVALTAGVLALVGASPPLRAWAMGTDGRWLLAPHLLRFVGVLFLVMHSRGELPWAFAVPGGIGDIAAALGAAALMLWPRSRRGAGWCRALAVWNVFGLADILMVVGTAAALGIREPASIDALTRLPLAVLPLWGVPLIEASHVLLGVRLWRGRMSQ